MVDEVVISEDYASCTAYTQTATNYPIVIHQCHMLHGFEVVPSVERISIRNVMHMPTILMHVFTITHS